MLEIRVLSELEVVREGKILELPASKKSRALLGYLAVTGKPHLREALCELLWPGPDDPRASLRWSLAKLRPLVDAPGRPRLVADRERVGLGGADVDLSTVRAEIAGDVSESSTETLQHAAGLFKGELLSGLDLPDCYRYHEWCIAEREAARGLRLCILAALVQRLARSPEQALVYARERVHVDPLVEGAHVDVVRLLTELGRRREALAQFETCRRLLANELGTKPSPALQKARVMLGESEVAKPLPPTATPVPLTVTRSSLVGRETERAVVASAIRAAAEGRGSGVLLLDGDSGIGKTRLLEELGVGVRAAGGTVLSGRAYEAEMVRPYGAWIDALRSVALGPLASPLEADLAPLLPELGARPDAAGDRNRLFDAVGSLLTHLASRHGVVAVVLDDIQWFDEASVALLHFVVRALGPSHVLVACAARPKELSDNVAAARLVRTLNREGRLHGVRLLPLDEEATSRLVGTISRGIDGDRVFKESAGNPLFVVEMTLALARSDSPLSESLEDIIEDRLDRLEDRTRELLPWAAALGHGFTLGTLEQVTRLPPTELLRAMGELEQRSIVVAAASTEGYDFVHDMVRASAYKDLSEPRRRLIHSQIAHALDATRGADEALAGEIAHHAALGGEGALAARASVTAAERCLRLFANEEAVRIADTGMKHAECLSPEERIRLQLRLMRVLVLSSRWNARRQALGEQALRLSTEARDRGLFAEAAQGFHNLSILQHDSGDFGGAHSSTLLAEAAGRAADPLTCALQLSKSAQCLAHLDRDMDRAAALTNEAMALAILAGDPELLYLVWADGLLRAYSGDYAGAMAALQHGLDLARRDQEHWVEFECMARMTLLDLEVGENARALAGSSDLAAVAARMGDGSEGPVAEALEAHARSALGEAGSEPRFERALAKLREVDVKGMLAHVLVFAAELDLDNGRYDRAESRAAEALGAAELLNRRSLVALARAVLARVALARGELDQARAHLLPIEPDMRRPLGVSARARVQVSRVADALG